MDLLHRLIDKAEWLIAGLIGAIVASWWHKDDLTDWRALAIFLVTGVACSLYLTGMVSAYLGVTEPSIVAGIGFFTWHLQRLTSGGDQSRHQSRGPLGDHPSAVRRG